jgi:protein arginine kinase activator
MQCDSCHQHEATVFLTQIVNGKMQKVNLCPGCAKAKGVNDPTGFQLTDLLLGMGASQPLEKNPGTLQCRVCGFTQTDLKKTGRLGCSNCYEVFAEPLQNMLKGMHKGHRHTGKVPGRVRVALEKSRLREGLEQELESAVTGEEYERAAEIRDRLRQLAVEEDTPDLAAPSSSET